MPSTKEQKRELVKAYFNEMVIPRDLDKMGKFIGEGVVDHSSAPGMPQGVDGAKMFLRMNYASFPWSNYEIKHVITDGDLVTVVFTIEAEHTGAPYFGTPPSGKRYKVTCIEIERVPEDKFMEHWGGMDFIELSRQLGLNLFGEKERQSGAASAQAALDMAQRYIEGINTKNLDLLASAFAEDFIDHQRAPSGDFGNTKADMLRAHELLDEAFPDVRFEILDTVVEGDTMFLHVAAEGTHQGSYFGIPPTGKRVRWTAIRPLRFGSNGQFVEGDSMLDRVAILQQMGILPPFERQYDTEGNKALVRRLFEQLDAGNITVVNEVFAPDVLLHMDAGMGDLKGAQWLFMEDGQFRSAFHDLRIEIEKMVAQGDRVGTVIRYSGTHSGAFAGVPGTGQQMSWQCAVMDRIEDGKIVEHWVKMDRFSLLQQVGIIPAF